MQRHLQRLILKSNNISHAAFCAWLRNNETTQNNRSGYIKFPVNEKLCCFPHCVGSLVLLPQRCVFYLHQVNWTEESWSNFESFRPPSPPLAFWGRLKRTPVDIFTHPTPVSVRL